MQDGFAGYTVEGIGDVKLEHNTIRAGAGSINRSLEGQRNLFNGSLTSEAGLNVEACEHGDFRGRELQEDLFNEARKVSATATGRTPASFFLRGKRRAPLRASMTCGLRSPAAAAK